MDFLTAMILEKMAEGPEAIAKMHAASLFIDAFLAIVVVLLIAGKENKRG